MVQPERQEHVRILWRCGGPLLIYVTDPIGSLLDAFVGIIKDRSALKTANLPGSFTALCQNFINDALMSASRFIEADNPFSFILVELCLHGYFRMPWGRDAPGPLLILHM